MSSVSFGRLVLPRATCVLAGLRMVLAGEERPEESAARSSLPPHSGHRSVASSSTRSCASAISAPSPRLRATWRTARRSPSAPSASPARPPRPCRAPLHLGGELDVEDVGELLDHHLLDRLAELGREEAALLELHVARSASIEMIDAYVDGRPMPSRSSSFTRLASEKRGGGSVKCCDGVIARTARLALLDAGWRLLVLERLALALLARLAIEREEALELDDAAVSGTGSAPERGSSAESRSRRWSCRTPPAPSATP